MLELKKHLAQGGVGGTAPPSGPIDLPNPLGTTDIAELLNRITGFLLTIAAPIAAVVIIIGAFQMLFAAGNPEKFKTGQKTILYAAIGFAIVLIAKGITSIIEGILQ